MAPIWNPAVVLDIHQGPRDNRCVATVDGRLCLNSIRPVRQESEVILKRMSQMSPSSTDIPRQLALLAPVTLCKRWHRDKPANRQDEMIQRVWTRKIRDYVLQTQRIEAAQQTTTFTPTPNIIPQPEGGSSVVSPVAPLYSGNVSATSSEPTEDFDFDGPTFVQPDFSDFDDSAIDLTADIADEESDDNDEIHDDEIHDDEIHDDEIYDDEIHDDEIHDDGIHDDEIHDDESENHENQPNQPEPYQDGPSQCQLPHQSESQTQNQTQTQTQTIPTQPQAPAPLKFELSLQLSIQIPHLFSFPTATTSSTLQSNLFAYSHASRDLLLRGLSTFQKSVTGSDLYLGAMVLVLWAWRETRRVWTLLEGLMIVGFVLLGWGFGGLGLGMRG